MKFQVDIPFVHLLGFELEQFEDGQAQIRYAPLPEHRNAFGVTHGGALMTLLDVTMASAARSVQPEMGLVTVEMKSSFMQTAHGVLLGKGRLMHRSRSMAFAEATVFDAAGRACAHGTGTFKYTRPLAEGAPPSEAGQQDAFGTPGD